MSALSYRTAKATALKESYSDRGTGAREDLSVWKPQLFENEYRVMYVASHSRKASSVSSAAFVVKEREDSDGKALRPPRHFMCVWTDEKTGGNKDGQLWKAIPCDSKYVALGDVAIHRRNKGIKPGTIMPAHEIDSKFMCVRKSLVISVGLGSLKWTDAGSGGKYDGAVWKIEDSPGFKVGRGKRNSPSYEQYRLDYIPSPLYKSMAIIDHFECDKDASKPVRATFEYTVGTTLSTKVDTGLKAGISTSIESKISGGVEGIAKAEVSSELSTFMEATTNFSLTECKTSTYRTKKEYDVDPGKRAILYQLNVTDTKYGEPGLFGMQTRFTKLVIEDL